MEGLAAGSFSGGFDDPCPGAAAAFRAVLAAMASPGRAVASEGCAAAPGGVAPAAAAVLLTLTDPETPVWLAPGREGLAPWLAFFTGAPAARGAGEAAFAVGPWQALLPLSGWPPGTPDYPDRSTTLIVEVAALEGGPALALSGPGIRGTRGFAPALPPDAAVALAANAARFPLGVDLLFVAGSRLAALPRSTRIGEG